MVKLGIVIFAIAAILGVFVFLQSLDSKKEIKSPVRKEKPLEKYTFENLRKTPFAPSEIVLGRTINEENSGEFISQLFYFKDNKGKKVSGVLNVPLQEGNYPVIVMLRGFVPQEIFTSGVGTMRAGEFFAQNGFITLAPDFLGYGESDNPSIEPIEERFQTYTTTLSLLASLESLDKGLDASYSGTIKSDISKIGIWAHSNGGHIALSTLAITGANYPAVLWAPVSKPFPYSILYFTDEFDDRGKALRKVVANFEENYDAEVYSTDNYYKWIHTPLQIHQGVDDDAVPLKWSNQLVEKLEELEKDVEYFVYNNADHNLIPNGWNTAVLRSLTFYKSHFGL